MPYSQTAQVVNFALMAFSEVGGCSLAHALPFQGGCL
jgi:hypothetical protein